MRARRILAGFALLLAASTAAACAQVVEGTGTIAADVPAGGGGVTGSSTPSSTMMPSSSPSGDDDDDTTPSSTPSSSSGSGGTSPVCDAMDKQAVETAFGTSVTFGRSQSSGCQLRASDGRSMIVAVFDYLKLSEYKKADSTDLTVAGKPAIKTSTTIIYVARGSDPAAAGLIAAYFAGLRDGGDAIAIKVLEQVVPKFPK
jgi:hypothetical protein